MSINKKRTIGPLSLLIGVVIGSFLFVALHLEKAYAPICELSKDSNYKKCTEYEIAFVPFLKIAKFFDDHNGGFVALFTLVLIGVGWEQHHQMRRQSINAYKQLKLAREEFRATHRPKVRVRHFDINFTLPRTDFDPATMFAWSFHVTNIGDAPIIKVSVTYSEMWANDVSEVLQHFISSFKTQSFTSPLKPGESTKISLPHNYISDRHYLMRVANQSSFFVVGRVMHTDSSGIDRVTGFCRKCHQARDGAPVQEFVVVEGVDYEYED